MSALTPNFSLEEMTATETGLPNTPGPEALQNLYITAQGMELVRRLLGSQPIHVDSGFRSPEVNAAVGGVPSSAHLQGYACDFLCAGFGTPLDICRALVGSGIQFDQVIEEGTWTHISFAPALRRSVLTKAPGGGYRLGLPSD